MTKDQLRKLVDASIRQTVKACSRQMEGVDPQIEAHGGTVRRGAAEKQDAQMAAALFTVISYAGVRQFGK